MRTPCLRGNYLLRMGLVLVAVFGLVTVGVSAPQDTEKGTRCASTTKLDMVLNHPDDYFGKTVTLEGEMHRTFSDGVFSIEGGLSVRRLRCFSCRGVLSLPGLTM